MVVLVSVNLAVMNLILAVIVEKASEAREISDAEEVKRKSKDFEKASRRLFRLCEDLDLDKSGSLTFQELTQGYRDNPEFQANLKVMDIHEVDLEVVFGMLDVDNSGTVEYSEFVEQLYMMKTCDMHTTLVFVKYYVTEMRQKMMETLGSLRQKGGLSEGSKSAEYDLDSPEAAEGPGAASLPKPKAGVAQIKDLVDLDIQQGGPIDKGEEFRAEPEELVKLRQFREELMEMLRAAGQRADEQSKELDRVIEAEEARTRQKGKDRYKPPEDRGEAEMEEVDNVCAIMPSLCQMHAGSGDARGSARTVDSTKRRDQVAVVGT